MCEKKGKLVKWGVGGERRKFPPHRPHSPSFLHISARLPKHAFPPTPSSTRLVHLLHKRVIHTSETCSPTTHKPTTSTRLHSTLHHSTPPPPLRKHACLISSTRLSSIPCTPPGGRGGLSGVRGVPIKGSYNNHHSPQTCLRRT